MNKKRVIHLIERLQAQSDLDFRELIAEIDKRPETNQLDIFNFEDGEVCGCCGGRKRTWIKPLVAVAVIDLINLYKIWEVERQPIHINRFTKQRSNFYTLRYWGFVAPMGKEKGKRTAGMWQPTEKGIKFILGESNVQENAVTLNNQLIRFTGMTTNIRKVLGNKFDYDKFLELNNKSHE